MATQAMAVLAAFLLMPLVESVTPVQKVVELLNGMNEKGKKEKHDEQVQFAAYKQFCDDTSVEKSRSIAEAGEMIEKLTADIAMYNDDAAKFEKEIAKHDDDITTWSGDQKATTQVRNIEKTDYMATHKDYTESIRALKAGVKTLGAQDHATPQAGALLAQLSSQPVLKQTFESFLAKGDRDLGLGLEGMSFLQVAASARQPAAAAYDSSSGIIIDMLEKLVTKFEDEKLALEKQETEATQAYELVSQDLASYIATATKARTEKSEAKAKAVQSAAEATGDVQDTQTTKDDDSKYLADVQATCAAKSSAFEERQKLRSEEIEAIEKAIEILSSGAVSGNSEKHLPQLLQAQASSYAQLRTIDRSPAQLQVAGFLMDRADRCGSRILRALAMRVTEDPFKKVVKMIKDLITKLMEEANGEAEQKGFCDEELATSEQTRREKTEAVEILHAEIDELEASVSKLSDEITELTEAVGELDAATKKATEIRMAEKEKNTVTVKDAKEAQVAVASALAVLKEFYAKAGEATALLQQPAMPDAPYKGMGGESGGVVGMIEVIQSDFARLEAETTAAEEEAAKEYSQFTEDSGTDKTQKQTSIDNKTSKKQGDELTLQEKKSDLEGTQKELDAGLKYYDKLKPQCIDSGVSFEDRVARRKEEIASLQQALSILEGEAVA